jgi:hypothetical protein
MALALVACGSLYAGYTAYIEQQGFSLPEVYIEVFMEQLEKQIEVRVPAEDRAEAVREFKEGFRRTIDEFIEEKVKPYEVYIPLAVAAGLFMPMVTIASLLGWIPTVVLSLVFRLLTLLGVIKVISETQEVERLVIDSGGGT